MDQEKQAPWLVGAAVTVLVALIGAYATIKASQPRPEPSPKPQEKDLKEIYGPQLKNAVDLASTAEVQALRDLNESPLAQVYKGAALKVRSSIIDNFRKNGMFGLAQRDAISYGTITIDPDERHARVHVTPTWEVVALSIASRQCVGRWPPYEFPQTLELERGDSGWMIATIAFDNDTPPTIQPCR